MGTTTEQEVAAQAANWAKEREGSPKTHEEVLARIDAISDGRVQAEVCARREEDRALALVREACGRIGHINGNRWGFRIGVRCCAICGADAKNA